jgi:amino-acid N-acetyltransferase
MNDLSKILSPLGNSDDNQDYSQLIRWFRQATPYINAHRGKTFVMMLSGEAVAHSNISNIIHDIALLNSLGTRIVIVHGLRAQLDAKLEQQNIKSQFVQGFRVSDQATMNTAIQASSLIRSQLETRLSMGLPNSPMHGARVRVASANVITAKPAGIIDGVDLQHTGLVRKIDTVAMNTLLDLGNVVLLSPLGYSPTGEAFSLSYKQVASEIAIALQADKLIAFTDRDGISNAQGELLRELDPASAQKNIADQDQNSEFIRCAKTAIASVEGGVPRAHLMHYANDGALLQELYTVDGAGTLILSANFEVTRQATIEDIPAIIDIISPLEKQGVLVRRDRDKLEDEINYFMVVEREGLIVALAALYP